MSKMSFDTDQSGQGDWNCIPYLQGRKRDCRFQSDWLLYESEHIPLGQCNFRHHQETYKKQGSKSPKVLKASCKLSTCWLELCKSSKLNLVDLYYTGRDEVNFGRYIDGPFSLGVYRPGMVKNLTCPLRPSIRE